MGAVYITRRAWDDVDRFFLSFLFFEKFVKWTKIIYMFWKLPNLGNHSHKVVSVLAVGSSRGGNGTAAAGDRPGVWVGVVGAEHDHNDVPLVGDQRLGVGARDGHEGGGRREMCRGVRDKR